MTTKDTDPDGPKVVNLDSRRGPITVDYEGGTITGPDQRAVREAMADIEKSKARARQRRERWTDDNAESMRLLAASFPSLRGAPGTDPWNQDALLRWLCTEGLSHGELLAARFVLSVWNTSTDWEDQARGDGYPYPEHAKRFDLFEALGTWDQAHAEALAAWVELPFWP